MQNNGTGSTYDVAVKDYDQKLTLDASTYKLHEGDLITSYSIEVNTSFLSASGGGGGVTLSAGDLLTTTDKEKVLDLSHLKFLHSLQFFVKEDGVRELM